MPEKLPQHRHCQICGRAIKLSDEVCSEKCEKELKEIVKKRRLYLYIFYGCLLIVIVITVLSIRT